MFQWPLRIKDCYKYIQFWKQGASKPLLQKPKIILYLNSQFPAIGFWSRLFGPFEPLAGTLAEPPKQPAVELPLRLKADLELYNSLRLLRL